MYVSGLHLGGAGRGIRPPLARCLPPLRFIVWLWHTEFASPGMLERLFCPPLKKILNAALCVTCYMLHVLYSSCHVNVTRLSCHCMQSACQRPSEYFVSWKYCVHYNYWWYAVLSVIDVQRAYFVDGWYMINTKDIIPWNAIIDS